jgi:hypothetical protein
VRHWASQSLCLRLCLFLDDVEDYADYDSDFEPKTGGGHQDVDPYAGECMLH